ncbi:MAG: hypothetical protein ACLT69_15375 [Intestinibacter bartlettii]
MLRFENPHTYYVDLSSKLWNLKQELLEKSNYKEIAELNSAISLLIFIVYDV